MRKIDLGLIPCPPVTDEASAAVAGEMAEAAASSALREKFGASSQPARIVTVAARIETAPGPMLGEYAAMARAEYEKRMR